MGCCDPLSARQCPEALNPRTHRTDSNRGVCSSQQALGAAGSRQSRAMKEANVGQQDGSQAEMLAAQSLSPCDDGRRDPTVILCLL